MLPKRTELPELPYGIGIVLTGMELLIETRWEAEPGLVTTIKDCRSGQEVCVKVHADDVGVAIAWQDGLVNGLTALDELEKKHPALGEFLNLALRGEIQLSISNWKGVITLRLVPQPGDQRLGPTSINVLGISKERRRARVFFYFW